MCSYPEGSGQVVPHRVPNGVGVCGSKNSAFAREKNLRVSL